MRRPTRPPLGVMANCLLWLPGALDYLSVTAARHGGAPHLEQLGDLLVLGGGIGGAGRGGAGGEDLEAVDAVRERHRHARLDLPRLEHLPRATGGSQERAAASAQGVGRRHAQHCHGDGGRHRGVCVRLTRRSFGQRVEGAGGAFCRNSIYSITLALCQRHSEGATSKGPCVNDTVLDPETALITIEWPLLHRGSGSFLRARIACRTAGRRLLPATSGPPGLLNFCV